MTRRRLIRRRSAPSAPPSVPAAAVAEEHTATPTDTPTATTTATPATPPATPPAGRSWRELGPLLLLRAAHPRQAVLTAAGLVAAGALASRPPRELALIFVTVLVGQSVVGWHNDLVDRKRDARHEIPGKPVAAGLLDPGTVWFVLICAALLVVPLAVANGVTAGIAYLAAIAVSLLGNLLFRRGLLSWLTWAVSFALYPAFLSYGGWGGTAEGNPPEITVTVLAGLLGVCVHFLRALPGLVPDNRDGWRHLPLRVALRTGAPRLLWISVAATVLLVTALLLEGMRVGLTQ